MLGAPFGAGAAHIVQFRPIRVEQRISQRAEQAGNVGGRTPRPAAVGDCCSGRGANRDHDTVRAASAVVGAAFACW